jgi:hypothetical protein
MGNERQRLPAVPKARANSRRVRAGNSVAKSKPRELSLPKKNSRRPPAPVDIDPLSELLRTPPLTIEEQLAHIHGLGQRIHGYIKAMSNVRALAGTSAEARTRAVAAFYEQLALLEKRLHDIHEGLQLE